MLRHGQDRVADEHERQRARRLAHVGLEVVEELPAALVLVDPPDIHGKRPVDLERLPEPRRLRTRRHVRPDTDHDRWHALVPRERLDHLAFFGRVVHQRAHTPEDRREDREANRGVTLGGRNQNGATTGRADAVIRVIVAVAEEEAVVVVRRVAPEVADERRRCRTLCVKPGQLVREWMRRVEDVPREPPEDQRIAFSLDPKTPHADAVDRLHARRQLVLPRDVVRSARGQDFDLGVLREVLGDVAGVQLGPAIDRLAVALNDDGELH